MRAISYILWGHMECRVAHPLRLIAFGVGDTTWHSIGLFATLEVDMWISECF